MQYTKTTPGNIRFAELIKCKYRAKKSIDIGSAFYFVYDARKESYVYLESSFYDITGYPASLIVNSKIDFVKKYMHPDDFVQYLKITQQYVKWLSGSVKKQRENARISYDFRLNKPHGTPVRLLYQALHMEYNSAGNMLYIIGKCSDISHWKNNNEMVMHIYSSDDNNNLIFTAYAQHAAEGKAFSQQEKKIIKLLADGLNSKAIAGVMHISYNTANTHRRNMLKKANVRNTTELISFAHNHQLV